MPLSTQSAFQERRYNWFFQVLGDKETGCGRKCPHILVNRESRYSVRPVAQKGAQPWGQPLRHLHRSKASERTVTCGDTKANAGGVGT